MLSSPAAGSVPVRVWSVRAELSPADRGGAQVALDRHVLTVRRLADVDVPLGPVAMVASVRATDVEVAHNSSVRFVVIHILHLLCIERQHIITEVKRC